MDAFKASPYGSAPALETRTFNPPALRTRSKTASGLHIESGKAQSSSTFLSPSFTHERQKPKPSRASSKLGIRTHSSLPLQIKAMTTTSARSKATDRPRSWKRGRCSNCVPQYSADRIKETNPCQVDLLWRQVMAPKRAPQYSLPTMSSRLRNEANPSSKDAATSEIQTSSSVTQPSTTQTSQSQGAKNPTVRHKDFEETQLIPRGIEICKQRDLSLGAVAGAHAYFSSETPPDLSRSRDFYKSIVEESLAGRNERDINDSIFLPLDADFIRSVHTAYRSLVEAGLPEPEFQAYACEKLFVGQYVLLASDATRQLCAVRSVQWSLKPSIFDARQWHTPPLLSPNNPPAKPFDFDIYPDCQFWLCDKILNAEYRDSISHVVHCKALGTFCPYFSIEFKATTDNTRTVVNQVTAAGSVSLFNRYQLKLDAHSQPTLEQLKSVLHFGLTMEKETWTVWLFEPKIANEAWAGCKIQNLDGGTCKTEQGVRRLLSWINEIHRWGLCKYALGCEDDIKRILSRSSTNIRVSAIGS